MLTTLQQLTTTNNNWLDDFLQSNDGKSANTIAAYRQDIRHFAAWFQIQNSEPFHPALITTIDLRAYRAHALAGAMTPASYNRRRITLRLLCQWSIAAGHLSYDPSVAIDDWTQQELPPRWLDKNDLARFQRQAERAIHAANTSQRRLLALRNQALIAVMLYCGLRESEAINLNWQDIEIGGKKGRLMVMAGKNDKSRQLPLNRESRQALIVWKNAAAKNVPAAPVFPGQRAFRLTTRQVQRIIAEIASAAGLAITPHDLRHTFAKRALDRGAPLTVVSKLLGHSRLETTARYVQPGWADLEKAVED